MDWAGFDRGYARQTVSLPTYPFERDRYWIEPAPTRRPEPISYRHPLLHRRVRSAALREAVFETSLSRATHPWIFDHRVHGTVILPGTGFVEIGLAAAVQLWGEGSHAVEDLSIHTALVVRDDGPTTLQAIVSEVEGRSVLRVFSSTSDGSDAGTDAGWTMHAEATLVRHAEHAEAVPNAAASPMTLGGESLAPADFYARLDEKGLALGPAFRGLQEIHYRAGEAYARISVPEIVGHDPAYVVNPVLLDNAIQIIGAALSTTEDSFVPVSIQRVQAHRSAGTAAWGRTVVRQVPAPATSSSSPMLPCSMSKARPCSRLRGFASSAPIGRRCGASRRIARATGCIRWPGFRRPERPRPPRLSCRPLTRS